jgi:hypothetical protein
MGAQKGGKRPKQDETQTTQNPVGQTLNSIDIQGTGWLGVSSRGLG